MARVTTEDCIDAVPNRFELVILAAHRARALANGSPAQVERSDDRETVIALREIAEGVVNPDQLREEAIGFLQKYLQRSESELEDNFNSDRQIKAWAVDDE